MTCGWSAELRSRWNLKGDGATCIFLHKAGLLFDCDDAFISVMEAKLWHKLDAKSAIQPPYVSDDQFEFTAVIRHDNSGIRRRL